MVDLIRRCGSGMGLVEKLLFWNGYKGEVVILGSALGKSCSCHIIRNTSKKQEQVLYLIHTAIREVIQQSEQTMFHFCTSEILLRFRFI